MKNIKIIICAHKEVELPRHPYFLPIQAGAALHDSIVEYQSDAEGVHISEKNPNFCELTAHYWAWKNLSGVDIIGLNHYRRYFDFQENFPRFAPDKKFVKTEVFLKQPYIYPDVEKILMDFDVILPPERHWRVSNTKQYEDYHIAKDWETLRNVIKEHSPQYYPAFVKTMDNSNKSCGYNMFIMRWELFHEYSKWLFDILFEVERRTDLSNYDPVQSRIYGYMSERLITVFCEYKGLKVKRVPLIVPLDDFDANANVGHMLYTYRQIVNDLKFVMSK